MAPRGQTVYISDINFKYFVNFSTTCFYIIFARGFKHKTAEGFNQLRVTPVVTGIFAGIDIIS